jgi:membrane protein DedA with SNARE-associated domain
MKKTGLSTAAGILDIVAGVFTILSVFCMLFFVAALKSFVEGLGEEFQVESDFASLIVPGVTVIGGIVAIVAGILLLRKKNRTRAIVGAVGSTLTLSPLGVAALVVTIVARREFER